MGKQHFYSRVPAKMAMFYKSDGYDTFACSKGVERDFIEKEMQVILDQKLNNDELGKIRQGEMPTLYAHFSTKSGYLVESCVTYIPLDYTNERSSYLVHSVIYDEPEIETIHNTFNNTVISKTMFAHDFTGFDITDPDGKPNNVFRDKMFVTKDLPKKIKWIQDSYDPKMVKILLYAITAAVCGKYKSVYVALPDNDFEDKANDFFNAIIQVFPYNIRKNLSYLSRVGDFNKFASFKLKFYEDYLGVPTAAKGAVVNFKDKLYFNIKDTDLGQNGGIADFFYSLLGNEEIRREFQDFSFRILKNPKLNDLSLKEVTNLVFMFKACSGFYDEKVILPDDAKVLEFITVYEKYRFDMTDEYRINGIKCLKRYSQTFKAIPKPVFSKIVKIYPTEIHGTKYTIMSACIDLIHTDLMRPQLFNFMKNVYKNENIDMRRLMLDTLSQVFYGGFLQNQIIEFYDTNYGTTDDDLKEKTLSKMLLAIRTPDVQESLINYLKKYYGKFSENEKAIMYKEIIDQYNEDDDLAKKLIMFMEGLLEEENKETEQLYRNAISKKYESNTPAQNRVFMSVVSRVGRITSSQSAILAYNRWKVKKVGKDFTEYVCSGNFAAILNKVMTVYVEANKDGADTINKISSLIIEALGDFTEKVAVSEILRCENDILDKVSGEEYKDTMETFVSIFVTPFMDLMFNKNIKYIFDEKEQGFIEKLIGEKGTQRFENNPLYESIKIYLKIKENILSENINREELIKDIFELKKFEIPGKSIGGYLLRDIPYDSLQKRVYIFAASSLFINGNLGFEEPFLNYLKECDEKLMEAGVDKKAVGKEIINYGYSMLDFAITYYMTGDDERKKSVLDKSSGVADGVKFVTFRYTKLWLNPYLKKNKKTIDKRLNKCIVSAAKSVKPSKTAIKINMEK